MPGTRRVRDLAGAALGLASALAAAAVTMNGSQGNASRGAATSYSPVAPAAAIHAGLQANLKIVRDWLADRDFASAAESAQGLVLLADVYAHQSVEAQWQDRAARLADACRKLAAEAKAERVEAADAAARECARLLDELARHPPSGDKVVLGDLKPAPATRTLMKLLDGTYSDAKYSKTPADMSNLAYVLAEGANLASHLRSDARWREAAIGMRDAAVRVAETAQKNDLDAARAELKRVYNQCESCHQRSRKR